MVGYWGRPGSNWNTPNSGWTQGSWAPSSQQWQQGSRQLYNTGQRLINAQTIKFGVGPGTPYESTWGDYGDQFQNLWNRGGFNTSPRPPVAAQPPRPHGGGGGRAKNWWNGTITGTAGTITGAPTEADITAARNNHFPPGSELRWGSGI